MRKFFHSLFSNFRFFSVEAQALECIFIHFDSFDSLRESDGCSTLYVSGAISLYLTVFDSLALLSFSSTLCWQHIRSNIHLLVLAEAYTLLVVRNVKINSGLISTSGFLRNLHEKQT